MMAKWVKNYIHEKNDPINEEKNTDVIKVRGYLKPDSSFFTLEEWQQAKRQAKV